MCVIIQRRITERHDVVTRYPAVLTTIGKPDRLLERLRSQANRDIRIASEAIRSTDQHYGISTDGN